MKIILFCILIVWVIILTGCPLNKSEIYLSDLNSTNPAKQQEAISYVGQSRVTEATPDLVRLVNTTTNKTTLLKSIQSLGQIGNAQAVDCLVKKLKNADPKIQEAAVEALGMIKDKEAVPDLIEYLDFEKPQLTCIWALGNIGGEEAVDALKKLLSHEEPYLYYNTYMALKQINNHE